MELLKKLMKKDLMGKEPNVEYLRHHVLNSCVCIRSTLKALSTNDVMTRSMIIQHCLDISHHLGRIEGAFSSKEG